MQAAGYTLVKTNEFERINEKANRYADILNTATEYKRNCEILAEEVEYHQSIDGKIARAKSMLEILYWLLLMVLLIYIVRKQFFS
jgi:hypothetical protein